MSNISGISISPDLAKKFPAFVKGDSNAAILSIVDESVELERELSSSNDDIDEQLTKVRSSLSPDSARYIVWRLPSNKDEFVFIQFMPDAAPISKKMKYASTATTIHRELGGSKLLPTTIFWTELHEVSEKGWNQHVAHEEAEDPLTEEELSLRQTVEAETNRGTRTVSVANSATLGISAQVSPDVREAVANLSDGQGAAFTVGPNETIELGAAFEVKPSSPSAHLKHFDGQKPLYGVIRIPNQGTVFLHYSPQGSSIKERMIFASTRVSFLEWIRSQLNVDKIVESAEPSDDFGLDALSEEFSTSGATSTEPKAQRFRRPKPPGRR